MNFEVYKVIIKQRKGLAIVSVTAYLYRHGETDNIVRNKENHFYRRLGKAAK